MKKITIIALHLTHGGIEQCVANVSNMLCDKYDVNIVSIYKLQNKPSYHINKKVKIKYLIETTLPKDFKKNGLKYYIKRFKFVDIIKGFWIKTFGRKIALKRYLKHDDSDIIIATHMFMYPVVSKNCKVFKLGWEHNHHSGNQKYINEYVKNSEYMDEVVVVSESLQESYEEAFKKAYVTTKVTYIPNFIDIDTDHYSELNTKNLISVGRMSQEKGFNDLIDVMKILVKKDNEIKLNLIGDGAEFDNLNEKIKKYKLENNIFMHGYLDREDIIEISKISSLYIMTSHTESFGLVLIEDMCFKVPSIAFDSAEGANDLIKHGYNGYLIKDRNKEKMAKKILELLNDKKKLKRLGENALLVSKKYTKEHNLDYWTKLIEGVDNE